MPDEAQTIGELRRIIEKVGSDIYGPAPEEQIVAAEEKLGLTFPPSYRSYLQNFGALQLYVQANGLVHDLNLHGLIGNRDDDDERPWFDDVVNQTIYWREILVEHDPLQFEPLQRSLIYVGDHLGGWYRLYLNSAEVNEQGEAPVLIEGHGIPLQIFASSFLAALRQYCDEDNPFAYLVQDPPRSHPEPVEPEPTSETKGRYFVWAKGEPDPAAPAMGRNATFLGLDPETRDVFVHAQTMGIDLMQQLAAMDENACYFANPSKIGETGEPFVAIDYLARHHPDIYYAYGLEGVKQSVLDAFDQAGEDDS